MHAIVLTTLLAFSEALFTVPVPMRLSELQGLASNVTVKTSIGTGTAMSLAQVFEDQESRRLLNAGATAPVHLSVLPRTVVRQETTATALPAGASAAPAATPLPEPAPSVVATVEGHYRPGEITAWVRLIGGEFDECATRLPNCTRIDLERDGGPMWQLGAATAVAKKGYTIEGWDYTPDCGAFRLQYEMLKPDKYGVTHIKFQLRKMPTWPEPQPADCKMTIYAVPVTASAKP